MKSLIRVTVFLASLLLFLVEPMAARQLLPLFGGSAAVWITCLVFFQAALLGGYLYAHLLVTRRGAAPLVLHGAVLLGATLSAWLWAAGFIGLAALLASSPLAGICVRLALWIGLPFLLLASTSPLLQAWSARTGAVPYRLFGLSNLASLLALLAYPTLIEPHLALRVQRLLWAAGVTAFALLSGLLTLRLAAPAPLLSSAEQEPSDARATRRSRLLWFLLPLAGSLQLSAITEHLTVNVAAIPLLWVLPLAVYLATFVVAFQFRLSLPPQVLRGLFAVMLVSLGSFAVHPEMALPIGLGIGLFLLELLLACLFCHTELYNLRPARPSEVTPFYLTIAAGGATGAFLVGIAAPLVFHGDYDLSITLACTGVLALAVSWREGLQQRLLWASLSLLLVFFFGTLRSSDRQRALFATRNFYGGLRVTESQTPAGASLRTISHGTVAHGSQIVSRPGLPTSYYAPDSGVALALGHCCGARPRNIGVIGLGAGTLAAYARPGDRMRFYEINPAVRSIAQDFFTYLHDSPASITFAEGDGRASLAAEPSQHFDVLAIDAFSGDAIPLHLLTVQAMEIYRRHLAPGGVLAFHVSNRYVDLEPELAALAQHFGMAARGVTSKEDGSRGESAAVWVLLTVNGDLLRSPELAARGHELAQRAGFRVWTDDYSSLLPLVRW